ncbi:MAG: hypothetical protein A3G41_06745 [Elusimicrobia bacterium RIFCSPLOWO2_12_FULL_59_9]|nr:MAG: hypothetical protein A3G41_06745 [Elusimicrobia bacterium RIFCSPLOWO2_12_FULL_59_9]
MVWMDAVIHWVHLMAAATWVGGMIFTALLLNPLLKNMSPEIRMPLIRALGVRFKYAEWGCLAALALTGTYKLSRIGAWGPIFEGSFGAILSLKLLLTAAMVALSLLHSFLWGPGLTVATPGTEDFARLRRRTIFWARVNLSLGLVVVFCAALLRMNPL